MLKFEGRIMVEEKGETVNIEVMAFGQPPLEVPKSELVNLIKAVFSFGIATLGKKKVFRKILDDLQEVFLPIFQERLDRAERNKNHKEGYVYFVLDTTTNAIKIGSSFRPKKRFLGLQMATAHDLVFLGQIKGIHKEKKFHDLFRSSLIRREWFNLTNEQEQFLKLVLE